MNKTNRIKILVVVTTVTLGIIGYGFYKIARLFSPGSYPYAEQYEIRATEEKLINAINKFKVEHPEMLPPDSTGLQDGSGDPKSFFYHVYFYYPKENQLLHTWVRSSDEGSSTFAFDAINDGTVLGNWKQINEDFSMVQNKEEKKKFEERILNKIKVTL